MTQNELLIIYDIKGDMCRLGYLKILTLISKERKRYRITRHAELLKKYVTKYESIPANKYEKPTSYFEKELKAPLSKTAQIYKAGKTSEKYIEFSYRLKIFNQKTK